MSMMAGPSSGGGEQEPPDIPFNEDDLRLLLRTLASIYSTEERAVRFLSSFDVRYPRERIPTWQSGSTALDFWGLIFEDLGLGVMAAPFGRLFRAALANYQTNQHLLELQRRQAAAEATRQPPAAEVPTGTQPQPQPTAAQPSAPDTCRLIAWLDAEQRTELEAWLTEQGLDPHPAWLTATSVSFRVNETDPNALGRLMRARSDLNWTIVAPGDPDYVIRYLPVQGPDGRSFRFNDVPSATPVGSVASELQGQYTKGMPGGDQPTVVEDVSANGSRRMNPDNTLAQEGITEGSRLRVGFERRAAAVNPLLRRDALFRVRNQLLEYAETHPGFVLRPNSPALPTEYDIEFDRPSFGPPANPGEDQPTEISAHQVSIVLGPEFPITAPQVRWLTDIFHPNVFPTYESELLWEKPYMRGLVCLGTLAESYQPSLDFGDLCATLEDIAGYQNYSVFVPADAVDDATGQQLLRGDYYDRRAAEWAVSARGQEQIRKIGGAPAFKALAGPPARLGFEIDIDTDVSEPVE